VARPLCILNQGRDEKAIEAVLQWKFKTALHDGKSAPMPANVQVQFSVK